MSCQFIKATGTSKQVSSQLKAITNDKFEQLKREALKVRKNG